MITFFEWVRRRRHKHEYILIGRSVWAQGQKGNRETIYVHGDYEQCADCFEGRFIPSDKNLKIVPCVWE